MAKVTICLIGIDGSGKTTHVVAYLTELRRKGVACRFAYMRGIGFEFFSLPLRLTARCLGYDLRLGVEDNPGRLGSPHRNAPLAFAWTFLHLLDVSLLILVRRHLTKARVIVCDRYIHDSIVDLMAATQDPYIHRAKIATLFLCLTKPSMTILLDVDEKEALRRKAEFSLAYLKRRRDFYRRIADELRLDVVDSGMPFKQVHEQILELTESTVRPLLVRRLCVE